ncbi:hypothetical protein GCM10022405_12130 [Gibbsiella dentisursi]|uniref:Uncharacterized protein n=1 Tax=Gibbsiella dentisursi TaxID=796890 RepID=A0ABP7KXN8_9GAMM
MIRVDRRQLLSSLTSTELIQDAESRGVVGLAVQAFDRHSVIVTGGGLPR